MEELVHQKSKLKTFKKLQDILYKNLQVWKVHNVDVDYIHTHNNNEPGRDF